MEGTNAQTTPSENNAQTPQPPSIPQENNTQATQQPTEDDVIELVVTGSAPTRYRIIESSVGTRTDTPSNQCTPVHSSHSRTSI